MTLALAGEAGVQGIYMAQGHGAYALGVMSALFMNAIASKGFLEHDPCALFDAAVRGYELGKKCQPLALVAWEEPLGIVRERVGLPPGGA